MPEKPRIAARQKKYILDYEIPFKRARMPMRYMYLTDIGKNPIYGKHHLRTSLLVFRQDRIKNCS
jgi:hypothetical protein